MFIYYCQIILQNTPGHDIELIDRGDVPPPLIPPDTGDEGGYEDAEHHYSIIRDDPPYDLQYEQPVAANNPVYVVSNTNHKLILNPHYLVTSFDLSLIPNQANIYNLIK